jgi:hypothetical protein
MVIKNLTNRVKNWLKKVSRDQNDDIPGYLNDKIKAGTGIILTDVTEGGIKKAQISVDSTAVGSDTYKVKVTGSGDPDYYLKDAFLNSATATTAFDTIKMYDNSAGKTGLVALVSMSDLTDSSVGGIANNEILSYSSSSSKYTNLFTINDTATFTGNSAVISTDSVIADYLGVVVYSASYTTATGTGWQDFITITPSEIDHIEVKIFKGTDNPGADTFGVIKMEGLFHNATAIGSTVVSFDEASMAAEFQFATTGSTTVLQFNHNVSYEQNLKATYKTFGGDNV